MTENTKKVLINTGLALSVFIIAFFVMAPLEVVRRAKREFLEGERHLSFYKNAEAKKQYYDEQLSKKKISEPQYRMLMEDNSLKNAYVQYQTVTDLFTPPESKWVKKSRERLKEIEPEYNAWVQQLQKEIEAAGYKKKPN
ncbi:MAG: hypothetical protein JXR81_03310 [Candidatus Goldbacteria bacterium]|nr:hypothetical protein [Candidatus Goldiibacteriota bacterium]